jgi:alpha-L-rhamnosidase
MKKRILVLISFQIIMLCVHAQITIGNLRTENLFEPVGIDAQHPRFSWQISSEKRNVMQSAYEIRVVSGKQLVWNSGKVSSSQSVHIVYEGTPLQSGKKYAWQVRIWDNDHKTSKWSVSATFQTGMLDSSDWKASWIEPGNAEDQAMRPSPLMRKSFSAKGRVTSATLYITAHGLYEAYINGRRVGDAWLTPGWTSYKNRLQYQAYDVTSMVGNGNNAIGVMLGNGWYRGIIGYDNNINVYGHDIGLLSQLEINYADGSSEMILSDGSWRSSTGTVVYSEIYNGEIQDAQKEQAGWNRPEFDDADWVPVKTVDYSKDILVATWNEPVKKQETFTPVNIFITPAGEQVIDFGQNLVGFVQMKVTGKSGSRIVLSHAEVLDKSGNFYTDNLRAAKAQDIFITNGEGVEVFEPHFTWHGFRYVKVEGYPGEIKPEYFTAVALYSDMKTTGSFSSSDSLINKLQHNIQWGQKGNFLDVPTDCPQRDERLGWTGDAQAFSRTAAYNMNVNSFFAKWLRDLEADQVEGRVPFVVPNVLGTGAVNSAGWADAATIIPWNMYLAYGDIALLERQYGSMKAYVESIRKIAVGDLWNSGFHFGDWLFYRPGDDNDGRAAVTDKYLIAQCFYAHSTQLLINAAKVLGKKDDAVFYELLLEKIKDAFIKEYLTPNGRLVSGTQTAYVLTLHFDMLPEALRNQAASRLAENVKSYNIHLTTGFLGTPYLCDVLSRFGHADLAYQLFLQKTYPSWLYPVTMGATTIWERWDGQKPDSTFQTPDMNSFNHYAYGAIGEWMYRTIAGLDTYEEGAGFKHSRIKPLPGGGLTHAAASLETYYGKLACSWKIEGDLLDMKVEVPSNTTCTVYIPAREINQVTEGGKPLGVIKDIKVKGTEDNYVVLNVGSGKYHFTVRLPSADI